MDLLVFNHFDGCVRLADGSSVRHPPLQIDATPSGVNCAPKRTILLIGRQMLLHRVSLNVSVRNTGQGLNQAMQKEFRLRRETRSTRSVLDIFEGRQNQIGSNEKLHFFDDHNFKDYSH